MRECSNCTDTLPIHRFRERADGYIMPICRPCEAAQQAARKRHRKNGVGELLMSWGYAVPADLLTPANPAI